MKKRKVIKMMKPKQPKVKVPKSIHINLTAEENAILAAMGAGSIAEKIHSLIQKEIDRQKALAKYLLLRKELKKQAKIEHLSRARAIEAGYTEEELKIIEDALDAPD